MTPERSPKYTPGLTGSACKSAVQAQIHNLHLCEPTRRHPFLYVWPITDSVTLIDKAKADVVL